MTSVLYQAKIGDGFKRKGLNRRDSFFSTPKDAITEALSLKETIDKKYKYSIEWDYEGKMTGSVKKVKFLKGFLNGDRESEPFYLQIVTVGDLKNELIAISPKKPHKVKTEDMKLFDRVIKLLKPS